MSVRGLLYIIYIYKEDRKQPHQEAASCTYNYETRDITLLRASQPTFPRTERIARVRMCLIECKSA